MSTQVTTAFVKQYNSQVQLLNQQKGSKLRNAVTVRPMKGEFQFFDQIGAVSAVVRTSRHADTVLSNTPHSRRRVTAVTYDYADLVDKPDKLRMLIDPTQPYAKNAAMAIGRSMDDAIIAAATGTAYTGVDGSTSTSFDTDMSVAADSASLTLAKVLKAKQVLDSNDIDPDGRYIIVHPIQIESWLTVTEVKSSDYNTVKALARGEVDTFLGFTWIVSTRVTESSSVYTCLFWQKDAMLMGLARDISTSIDKRPDKNNSTQVLVSADFGATRMNEDGVGRILCDES